MVLETRIAAILRMERGDFNVAGSHNLLRFCVKSTQFDLRWGCVGERNDARHRFFRGKIDPQNRRLAPCRSRCEIETDSHKICIRALVQIDHGFPSG